MFAGVTVFALIAHVHITDAANPGASLIGAPQRLYPEDGHRPGVGRGVRRPLAIFFYYLQIVTALILVLAANTAFNGFPVLASILSQSSFLPRQLRNRGDRLIFSNGVLLLAGFALILIIAFGASSTRLIQLYIVGVFVSFVCSQTGMIRHWNRLLLTETDIGKRRAHDALAGRQRHRRRLHGRGAAHRAADQVHPRRLHRRDHDADPVHPDEGDQQALPLGVRWS